MKLFRRSAIFTLIAALAISICISPASIHAQGKVYTLKECVDKALKTDLSVIRYRDYYRQAEANVLAAKGAFLPDLNWDMSGTYTRDKAKRYRDPITGVWREGEFVEDNHYYSASLRTNLVVFDGFSRLHNLAGSKAELSSTGHQVSTQELAAVYSVKSRYFGLLQAQFALEIRQKALERSQELMKIAQTRYELGSASLSDVLKAKVSLSQAQLDLLTAENNVRIGQANLDYAIGEPVDQEITVEDVEPVLNERSFEEVNKKAMSSNPAYLSAMDDLKSAEHGLKYARSDYFPSLVLSAGKSWTGPELGKIDEWWNAAYTAYISGSLQFNIFNRFQTKRQTDIAKAGLNSAQYNANDTRRAVELEVREAYLKLQETMKARELADEKLASAQEDHKLAQEKYTLGAATILDILDAELSLKTAESDQIDSKYNYLLAVARLQQVMGIIE